MRHLRPLAAAGLAAAGCVAYGVVVERRWYRLRQVAVPGVLPAGTPPLRILHVSDLHLDPPQAHLERFVAGLSEVPRDLVVATGDLLGGRGAEDRCGAVLAALTADGTPGVAVLGSNDRYGPAPKNPFWYFTDPRRRTHGARLDTDRLVARLEAAGYAVLCGEATALDVRGCRVAVGGLDDPHLEGTVLPPVDAIRVRDDAAVLRLGVVHAPYTAALDRLREAGYDLLLAGHTHGGQVRLPPFGALVANCDLPLDQARGLSRYDGAWLHVSPGLGTSRYAPFRFACRPEATLLHLVP